jgi:hypothetical protein
LSFASEPERDDGSLPPVNIVIPDDARELDRDVLAYRRELRAQRRRRRLMRLLRPFDNQSALGGPAAIVPLIALCLALALVGGALLSVVTMNPAQAPTVTSTPTSAQAGQSSGQATTLPTGNVLIAENRVRVRSLVRSVLALVPANCNCVQQWDRLKGQAVAAGVPLYFVATGTSQQRAAEADQYVYGRAVVADDADSVLATAYRPDGLTVLLVDGNAGAEVHRNLGSGFQLAPLLSGLKSASARTGTTTTPRASAAAAG